MARFVLIIAWSFSTQVESEPIADRFAVASKETKAKDIAAAKYVVTQCEEQLNGSR